MAYCLTGEQPYNFLIEHTPPKYDFNLEGYKKISAPTKEIIQKATANDKNERYPDTESMLKEIERTLGVLKTKRKI